MLGIVENLWGRGEHSGGGRGSFEKIAMNSEES
jgi:hypothetical protein